DHAAGALRLAGTWTLPHARGLAATVQACGPADSVDARALGRLDSAGAMLLHRLLQRTGVAREAVQIDPGHAALLDLVAAAQARPAAPRRPGPGPLHALLERVGAASSGTLVQARGLLGFLGLTLATLVRVLPRPTRWRLTPTVHHMEQTGL